MIKLVKNIAAVTVGFIIGNLVNLGIVLLGPLLIAPPPGVNMNDMDSISGNIARFGPQHFALPFLAHALGTFAGVLIAYRLAVSRKVALSYAVATLFLAGGVFAATLMPAPGWFIATDILLAYLPMAWLALMLARRKGRR